MRIFFQYVSNQLDIPEKTTVKYILIQITSEINKFAYKFSPRFDFFFKILETDEGMFAEQILLDRLFWDWPQWTKKSFFVF